ncbi:hypothetical protein CDL12_08648 [Handroanthus impetiginosus]|uniref:Late embryogenesis abundant protein LEA-2 subgroup domain-containing protein n=1 Tax=Handroanthus impetiginosus TaxID=429701 RepID=A0A2G9HMC6_9LAMI|nr:hypothetical protein CDL12_08648 [Handroanthus impetiginosus]
MILYAIYDKLIQRKILKRESLTTRISKLICAIFLALLILVGIITFILWLSLRPHRPRFHVQEFSMPSLPQESGFKNAQIVYNATVRNANQNIGIYYDSMQLTLYYQDQSIGGSQLLFPFYQKPKNTTVIAGELAGRNLTVTSQRWQEFMADLADGEVVFRFDITSTIRFKISTWDSKRHVMHANCPVGIGPDGLILPSYKDKRCPVYFV